MQTAPALFTQLAQGHVRPLAWQFRASFDKTFDPAVEFFELDTSLLDGPDLLAPSDDNVVQEWDKYIYSDYTNRIVQMEWSREEDQPYSVNLAMADLTLNNYDGYFTRGSSPLDPNVLPRRPVRLLSGFGNTVLPQFVGLTETVPKVDKASGVATVHCTDFLSFIFGTNLDETIMLEDVYTHEVLEYLFDLAGLTPTQYVLDESFNRISFVYWEKGTNLGQAIRELMQAELGSLYMDELGMIRFVNRVKISTAPVYTFDSSNIIDYRLSDESKIINVVEMKANIRSVQPVQPVYTLSEPIQVLAGETEIEFFSLTDPVTSIETITNYLANSLENGEGTDLTANIDILDVDAFANAIKVTFENTGVTDAYITELEVTGTPAKAIGDPLYVRLIDQDSIDQFEEQVLTIDNDFIQTTDAANSIGLSLLNYFGDYGNSIELDVKGTPALQLGDNIMVDIDNISDTYTITKIVNILSDGRYSQRLTAKVYNIPAFFILDQSLLNGEDVLAP